MTIRVASMTLVLVCGLAACGESHGPRPGLGSGPGTFSTGISSSRTLSELSTDEARGLCMDTADYLIGYMESDAYLRSSCALELAYGSADVAECEAGLDECVAEARTDPTDFSCTDVSGLDGCLITVGEYESCVEAAVQAIGSVYQGATCALTGDSAALDARFDGLDEPPAACAGLEARCPGLGFGGSSSSGGGSGGTEGI